MVWRLLRSSILRFPNSTLCVKSVPPSLHVYPRRLPRSQLRSTPLLRRAILHQRRSITTDYSSSSGSMPEPVVALPLSHRPLLPGMTIQLHIHESMYNKITKELDLNRQTMVGAFLVNLPSLNGVDDNVVVINGRPRRIRPLVGDIAMDRALVAGQFIDLPHLEDIHKVGSLCQIVEIATDQSLLIESLRPIVARSLVDKSQLMLEIEERDDDPIADKDAALAVGLQNELIEEAVRLSLEAHIYADHLRVVVERALASPMRPTELGMLANQIGGLSTSMTPDQEQTLVEERNPIRRAHLLLALMKSAEDDV